MPLNCRASAGCITNININNNNNNNNNASTALQGILQ